MQTAIIIVNFRTAELVLDCLKSLSMDTDRECYNHVIVVDNNSGDGSVEQLAVAIRNHGWEKWVSVLPLTHNGGFAFGNNRALDSIFANKTYPDYIWLLNPDTVVRGNACRSLLEFLQKHPEAGIAGSRLEDPDGTPQVSAFNHHSILSEFLSGMRLGLLDKLFAHNLVAPQTISSVPHQTEWIAGASMMVRSKVFKDVGLLDEGYFMYYEEEDFCKKACDAGWQCWFVPESRVVHLVGAASGISDTRKKAPRRPAYWFESRRRFFLKNYGAFTIALADTAWMIGYSIWRGRRLLQGKPDTDPPFFLKDFFSHSVFCKGVRL